MKEDFIILRELVKCLICSIRMSGNPAGSGTWHLRYSEGLTLRTELAAMRVQDKKGVKDHWVTSVLQIFFYIINKPGSLFILSGTRRILHEIETIIISVYYQHEI